MSSAVQVICASGIFTTIMTLILTRIVNRQFDQMKKWQESKKTNDFLLWTKIDKLGQMTNLMANKLHEAGIINGDLKELYQEYRTADQKYNDNLKEMAAEIMRK